MFSLHTSARHPGEVWNINNHHEGDCVRCSVFILLQDILERCGTLIIIMIIKGIVYECSVFILLQDILERCGTLIIIMKGIVYDVQSSYFCKTSWRGVEH